MPSTGRVSQPIRTKRQPNKKHLEASVFQEKEIKHSHNQIEMCIYQ